MSYSQRLTQGGSFLTRLSHRSRYDRTLRHIGGESYNLALDYGCGDGLLLRRAYDLGLIRSGIGVDVAAEMLEACGQRFAGISGFKFSRPESLSDSIASQSCDLAICTETLEHVASIEVTLEQILRYCQPRAKLVISVPIEIGPALVGKQIGRYLANRKGNYGHERYTWRELCAASIGWNVDCFHSSHNSDVVMKGHKGFDYRKVAKLLDKRVTVEKTVFSPFPVLGPWANSTVFWVCRVK